MVIDKELPLLSVRLMTYNHESFIKQAMDGIMMQQTKFSIKIVVGDDFSEDRTLEIIKSYENTENIKIKILERTIGDEYWKARQEKGRLYNFTNILRNCKGKYIALLDGDDYWIDPLKLQKQVDFLNLNTQYSSCYHGAKVVDGFNVLLSESRRKEYNSFSKQELISGTGELMTLTTVFRNNIKLTSDFEKAQNGDTVLWHLLGYIGPAKFMDNIESAAYRVHENGVWSKDNDYKRLKQGVDTYSVIINNLIRTNRNTETVQFLISNSINKYLLKQIKNFNLLNYIKGVSLIFSRSQLSFNYFAKFHINSIVQIIMKNRANNSK